MNDTDTDTSAGTALEIAPLRDTAVMPGFGSQSSWELANRIGKAFAASSLVPEQYRGNVANCIVALEMANRMGASPLMVMQNLYIVHGNPGWSSKFLIACFNQCGRFSALRYEWSDDRSACRAWAVERATGERIEGPQVSVAMADAEGWSKKTGSKWKTMPELMLMYRSAAFLIRTYAPEISMGLQTDDELVDVAGTEVMVPRTARATPKEIQSLLSQQGSSIEAERRKEPAHARPPEPPAFDPDQMAARISEVTDMVTLQLMSDEVHDMPDGPVKQRLQHAIVARDKRLAATAKETQ